MTIRYVDADDVSCVCERGCVCVRACVRVGAWVYVREGVCVREIEGGCVWVDLFYMLID